jgi:hypothetical protein
MKIVHRNVRVWAADTPVEVDGRIDAGIDHVRPEGIAAAAIISIVPTQQAAASYIAARKGRSRIGR